jgi:hypothetical protein
MSPHGFQGQSRPQPIVLSEECRLGEGKGAPERPRRRSGLSRRERCRHPCAKGLGLLCGLALPLDQLHAVLLRPTRLVWQGLPGSAGVPGRLVRRCPRAARRRSTVSVARWPQGARPRAGALLGAVKAASGGSGTVARQMPSDTSLPGPAPPWARVVTLVLLIVCAALAVAVVGARPLRRPHSASARRLPDWAAVLLVALGVRVVLLPWTDGSLYDVFHAYRLVGGTLRSGGDVYTEPSLGLANYPPVIYWWWAAASAVAPGHLYALVVRAPFLIADAAVAAALVGIIRGHAGRTAGLVYALSPVAMAVPVLHGQFEPLVVLPMLIAVSIAERRPWIAGLLLGSAIAIKPWPAFFLLPLLAALPRRTWPQLLIGAAAVPAASFGIYAIVHPQHVADGLHRVLTYQAHRQGFGISPLLPNNAPASLVNNLNVVAAVASVVAGVFVAHRGRSAAEAMAAAMLVLLVLSPTVSDQYLTWPLALLLLAGRRALVAALGVALLPAVVWVDLWASQDGGIAPTVVTGSATLVLAAAAVALLRPPPVEPTLSHPVAASRITAHAQGSP